MNKIIFNSSDIDFENNKYISPEFVILKEAITIQINCSSPVDVVILSSIDGEVWFPISNTNFTTYAYGGLQSYIDCQLSLLYKIECSLLPTSIIILL